MKNKKCFYWKRILQIKNNLETKFFAKNQTSPNTKLFQFSSTFNLMIQTSSLTIHWMDKWTFTIFIHARSITSINANNKLAHNWLLFFSKSFCHFWRGRCTGLSDRINFPAGVGFLAIKVSQVSSQHRSVLVVLEVEVHHRRPE